MKQVLYFLAGALVGLGAGYLIGKKHKEKTGKVVKEVIVTDEIEEEERENRDEEVEHVARKYGYVIEDDEDIDYDQDDIQSDIEDMEDYLSETEHPEDDEPEPDEGFVIISDDEYFTERHEFDKIRLFLDYQGDHLVDGLGNDYLDIFAEHGLSREKIINDAENNDLTVYYRNNGMESDFEVLYEGGE